MEIFQRIIGAIESGKGKMVKHLLEEALEEGLLPEEILTHALLPAMENVSRKFRCEEFYVPEVILASHAMTVGTTILEEHMEQNTARTVGKVVIGTVKGDLHNIGKNLVVMMLRSAGFEVADLGYDVEANTFIEKAQEEQADIICMSAMLTTTMPEMRKVISRLENRQLRDRYIVMVGGAPVTKGFAKSIGADIYTRDAESAAREARQALTERKKKAEIS